MPLKNKKIVVFASGAGSNAECIFRYFKDSNCVKVAALFCNKENAGVLQIAKNYGVDTVVFYKHNFNDVVADKLEIIKPDLIVLAGFLLQMPDTIVNKFKKRIINIHPALLPKFGGKGMYGMHVHKAVIDAREVESGITIHYVNEQYDEGEIIFQKKYILNNNETPESLQKKIQELEHKHYPEVINKLLCYERVEF